MRYLLTVILFFLFLTAYGQKVSFTAKSGGNQVLEGRRLSVTFTLANAKGSNFIPPEFDGFTRVTGPAKTSSYQNNNGRTSSSESYTFNMIAPKTGRYKIGSGTIKVGSKTLRSGHLTITVVKGKNEIKNSGSAAGNITATDADVFVKMIASDSTAYLYQQIVIDYRVYYKPHVQIRSDKINSESPFDGFFSQVIRNNNNSVERVIIDGEEYYTYILRSIALFPQTKGTFDISPARFTLFIPDKRRQGSFFNSYERLPAKSSNFSISIKDLPSPTPKNFSGAVGNYEMASFSSKNDVTTDDAFSLKIEIRGNGDDKSVVPPHYDFGEKLDVYDPNLLKEEVYLKEKMFYHRKSYEYLMVPSEKGKYSIDPDFTYFDVDSNDYITLTPRKISFRVRPGKNNSLTQDTKAFGQSDIELAGIGLTTKLHKKSSPIVFSSLFWILLSTLAFLFIGMFLYRRLLDVRENIDPLVKKSRQARKVALAHLKSAESYLSEGESREFYDETSKAILKYISDKLNIPPSEISKSNVQAKMIDLELSETTRSKVMDILNACEMSLFAGSAGTDSMTSTYQKSTDIITEIEAALIY